MTTQAHTRYRTKDGVIVPSVTTIAGLLSKPALVSWANKLGLRGIDVSKYVDELAEVGTLAHQMILDYFKNVETDFSEYSPQIRDKAENSFLSFLEWAKNKRIESIFVEKEGVSEQYRYGGRFDFYGILNGIKTIIDFKTGSGLYPEYFYQLSAYRWLLMENGYETERVMLVRIPRSEDETFEVKEKTDSTTDFEIFKRLLEIYYLQRDKDD